MPRPAWRRAAPVVACLIVLAWTAQAHALPSDVKLGCLSGSIALGPRPPAGVGSGACTLTASATSTGTTSGLGTLVAPAVSPDGRNVYALSGANLFAISSVVTFTRNTTTGALTFAGCITGDTAVPACTQIPTATNGAVGSGMSGVSDLAIAPDGKSVYVAASSDDAIVTFARNAGTGALTLADCDTGDTAVQSTTCSAVGSATAGGVDSGLDGLGRLTVSPINDFVTATAARDDAIVGFSRSAGTGALTAQSCATGEVATGPAGTGACGAFPGTPARITPDGAGSGFDRAGAVAYSPDALNLYIAAPGDDTVTTLSRPTTAATFSTVGQCMSGSIAMGPAPAGNNRCNLTNGATANGTTSELDNPRDIVVPADGLDVLVLAGTSQSVTTFGRGLATLPPPAAPRGSLAFTGCVTSLFATPCVPTPVTGAFSALNAPTDLTVAPDNTTVLAVASSFFVPSAEALTTLTRTPASGAIAFTRCLAGNVSAGPSGSGACALSPSAQPNGTNSGHLNASGVAVSPDNRTVYVTGMGDAAITWYGNDADADTVGDVADNCPAAANTNQSDLDGDGIGDVCDPTPTGPAAPPAGTTPASTTPTGTPPAPGASKGTPAATGAAFLPQLKVRTATVGIRAGRRTLRVEAGASTLANGLPAAITYRSSGVTTRRTVTVRDGRIRLSARLPATQPLSTGVLTISLGGSPGVRAQQVTVRAAARSAALRVAESRILNKKLRVSGTISPLATGAVLIRMDYSDKAGNPLSFTARARIFHGTWKTLQGLEPDARDGGVVTVLYPGLARSPIGPLGGQQDARALGVGR